ncbi:hypothetical protein D1AOALGA4SA_1913 [Olavius algarvensis Delta 1 endosymbiont]|nr:hypothetical protein D1AOALGA4SA_1913 [Olavius algarvensis Delta 1 endosymbiont]
MWFQVSGFRCQKKTNRETCTMLMLRLKATGERKSESQATPIKRIAFRC